MTRQWNYKGYVIESMPKGVHFKYVVYVSEGHIVAGTMLAEVFADLDRISTEATA